jgi:hypothetical protein
MKSFLSIVIIYWFAFSSCSSSKLPIIKEQEVILPSTFSNIIVDGRSDEWMNIPNDYSEGSTVEFSVANNASNLFVLLKVPSLQEQRKILEGGMDVWVSADGNLPYPSKPSL